MSSIRISSSLFVAVLVACLLTPGVVHSASKLLFVPVAANESGQGVEREVEQELLLTLDRVELEVRHMEALGFEQMPLAQQLEVLQPWASEEPVLAVAWLSPPADGRLLLHLVLVAEGRTVLRVVEASAGPGGVGALALAAREVLSLLLVSREKASQDIQTPPPDLQADPQGQEKASPPASSPWSLHFFSGVGLRPSASVGPPALGQFQLGVGVVLTGRLSLAVDGVLLVAGGPQATLQMQSIGGGAHLRWLPGDQKLGAGPTFSVLLTGTRLRLKEGVGLSVEQFEFRLSPGFGLRFNPVAQVGLFLQAGLDVLPIPWEARRRSTGELLFSSSLFQARVSCGVRVQLPPLPLPRRTRQ